MAKINEFPATIQRAARRPNSCQDSDTVRGRPVRYVCDSAAVAIATDPFDDVLHVFEHVLHEQPVGVGQAREQFTQLLHAPLRGLLSSGGVKEREEFGSQDGFREFPVDGESTRRYNRVIDDTDRAGSNSCLRPDRGNAALRLAQTADRRVRPTCDHHQTHPVPAREAAPRGHTATLVATYTSTTLSRHGRTEVPGFCVSVCVQQTVERRHTITGPQR